jgi:hypothetical protein
MHTTDRQSSFFGSLRPSLGVRRARILLCALLVWTSIAIPACSTMSEKKREAIYDPVESVTEVVAILRRHIPDDTYRFPPGRDFTGRNIYRSSLIRLENIEKIHSEDLKSGYMDSVVAFSKGRALERLRAYDLAAKYYHEAARKDGELREEALRSASVCEAIGGAIRIGIDLEDPTRPEDGLTINYDFIGAGLDARTAELVAISTSLDTQHRPDSHYRFVIRQEIERADMVRALYFVHMRAAIPNGSLRAIAELQSLVSRHASSQNHRRHILKLADLYADLAREYVEAVPAESLHFDPPRFQELVDAAAELYRSVAVQDGTTEKLEAGRQLEAFLAFTLRVDSDRFAQ